MLRIPLTAISMSSCLEELLLSVTLELDEALFGGKHSGKRSWGVAGKAAVFGIYKRSGRMLTFPVPEQQTKMLIPLIKEFRTPGSLFSPTTSTASRGSGPMRSTGCRPTTASAASTSTCS